MKALYYLLIKNAKIENIGAFLKEGDMKTLIFPSPTKKQKSSSPTKTVRSKINNQWDKTSPIRIKKKMSGRELN